MAESIDDSVAERPEPRERVQDALAVVDREERLLGALPLNRLIVSEPDTQVADVMEPPVVRLQQHENVETAASAFERYDLVSAPVVDTNGKLVGRMTVDEVLDFVRRRGETTCSPRPACARRRMFSHPSGNRSRTAGRGSRSIS